MRLKSPAPWIAILLLFAGARVIGAGGAPGLPYSGIRSVTWYDFPKCFSTNPICLQNFQAALPRIRSNGFNAVWLVLPWVTFNPRPLSSPPQYSDEAFAELAKHLDVLRTNHMEAIIGLNYVGPGWSPEGIDSCWWRTDPIQYKAFEDYAAEFLTRISSYHDMVYILLFTEGASPCNLDPRRDAARVAAVLRPTLGSLPVRLPAEIRSRFRIGYHDYSIIDLGYGNGASPIQDPISFDFLSMALYGFESLTNEEIAEEIDTRAARFAALYPEIPLIAGELGASRCQIDEVAQARVLSAATTRLRDLGIGFNVWRWQPLPPYDSCIDARLEITGADGSLSQAALDLRSVVSPLIHTGTVSPTPEPWTVTLTGKNFSAFYRARMHSSDRADVRDRDVDVTLSPDATRASFVVPAGNPPANCRRGKACSIQVTLVDTRSGLESARFAVKLPKITDTVSPIVTLTSSFPGDEVVGNTRLTLTADASDNISLRKVEFYVNNKRICTDTSGPYTCPWKVPNKAGVAYVLTTKAYDSAKNSAASSIAVRSR